MESLTNAQGSNPIETDRRSTDKFFFLIFVPLIILWLIIGTSELNSQQGTEVNNTELTNLTSDLKHVKFMLNAPFQRFSYELLVSALLSFISMLLIIFLTKTFTDIMILIGIMVSSHSMGETGAVIVFGMIINGDDLDGVRLSWWFFGTLIPCLLGFTSGIKTGFYVSRDIIKDSCHIILMSPWIILFQAVICVLDHSSKAFMTNVMVVQCVSGQDTMIIYASIAFTLLCGCIMVFFLEIIGIMVVADYTISYFWKNEEKPRFGHSIAQSIRYHIGTMMFAATLPISYICAIVKALKHERPDSGENYVLYFISKIIVLIKNPFEASVFTSVHGIGFIKSSQTSFDTILRRCLLYLVTAWIIDVVCAIPSGVLRIANFGAENIIKDKGEERELLLQLIDNGVGFPVVCFNTLISYCAKALLFNQIILFNNQH